MGGVFKKINRCEVSDYLREKKQKLGRKEEREGNRHRRETALQSNKEPLIVFPERDPRSEVLAKKERG